ncbi:hypothetical protein niasHT_018715 [Heterodera trifolii]|uniref:MATH domain-containing protein n=1 Tax=Heterodera trifolii TaxID=157864 RepID=A0ABD2LDL8_9BILA
MFRYDEGQIEIPDTEIEAFKTMLTFIYTKHFNGLDANNLLEVLKAADKYNITGLVKECVEFPIEKLPNVFVAFEQSLLLNMEALHWADEQCRQNDIECSADNRGKMLDKVLPNIRFPLIPKEDFTKSVVPTGVLTIEEVISIYQHYSHPNLSDAPGLFPLKFPTHRRNKSEGTIEMEIEKVSEFAVEEVGSRRFSDAVEIGGFSWEILAQIRTKNENNEKWLGVFLYNDGTKKSKKALTLFELLDPSKGFYNRKEDKIKLAIDVIVDEPKTEKFISDPNKSNGTISMEIEKLSEFAREIIGSERRSETVHIGGLPWKIWADIKKKKGSTDNNEKWLSFSLLCDAPKEDENWSCECSSIYRIVSQNSGFADYKRGEFSLTFNNKSNSWGYSNFISFAELMDPCNGLYEKKEDKVTLAIDVTLKEAKMADNS